MPGAKGRSGGKREGAGRPTLTEQFAKQKEAVEVADAFGEDSEFKAELAQMLKLQKRIAARLDAARAIVEELEPLTESSDWRLMSNWVKNYGVF